MVDAQQEIVRSIKIVKPYHAQALVDGWLCIKYLDGEEESLSTFADVSKGDIILYGNAARSRPAPSAPDYRELFVRDLLYDFEWTANNGNPEFFKAVEKIKRAYLKSDSQLLNEHDATIRNQTLDELETFVRTDHSLNRQIRKRIMIAKIQSLRTTEAQK